MIQREMIISRVRQRRVAERIQVSEQEVKNSPGVRPGQDAAVRRASRWHNILIPTPKAPTPKPSRMPLTVRLTRRLPAT